MCAEDVRYEGVARQSTVRPVRFLKDQTVYVVREVYLKTFKWLSCRNSADSDLHQKAAMDLGGNSAASSGVR